MPRKMQKVPSKDRTTQVVDSIYNVLKGKDNTKALYPSIRKRVTDILAEALDPDQVELVCLTIIDDSFAFSVWKSFNWVYYEMVRDTLEVPDGAWKYALWAYKLKNEKLQISVNYWLGIWFDADQDGEPKAIEEALNSLELLWLKHNDVQELKW